MEKGINQYFLEKFGMKQADIRSYSPLTLAYIGDGIYDLVIRSMMVGKGNAHVNDLHRRTSKLVKAHAQSELIGLLKPELTEEELAVYRRGRNAKSFTMAKNATVADYRRATGFEALMGYLYLENQMDRMMELILTGLKRLQENCRNAEAAKRDDSRERDDVKGKDDSRERDDVKEKDDSRERDDVKEKDDSRERDDVKERDDSRETEDYKEGQG